MLFDIIRFNTLAIDVLRSNNSEEVEEGGREDFESMGEYLEREGYSKKFMNDYLLPITGSIWGVDCGDCRDGFPIRTLVRYM